MSAGGHAAAAPAPKQRRLTSLGVVGRERGRGRGRGRGGAAAAAAAAPAGASYGASAPSEMLKGLEAGMEEAAKAEQLRHQIETMKAKEGGGYRVEISTENGAKEVECGVHTTRLG